MRTKIDFEPVENFFLKEISPETMAEVLIEVEEAYVGYLLRDTEIHGPDVDRHVWYIREFRKVLQEVLK